jgi:hypothetical protein
MKDTGQVGLDTAMSQEARPAEAVIPLRTGSGVVQMQKILSKKG